MIKYALFGTTLWITVLMMPLGAMAAEQPMVRPPVEQFVQVQEQNAIRYVSGGIGIGEREFLNAISGDFNLKLVFAMREGHYLNDIQVRIEDQQGNTVLEDVSNGPWFFANLMPAAYRVQVSSFGQSHQQTARVPAVGLSELIFYWR